MSKPTPFGCDFHIDANMEDFWDIHQNDEEDLYDFLKEISQILHAGNMVKIQAKEIPLSLNNLLF